MLTGLWDLKDILNLRQNRSEKKLVRENAVEVARSRKWAPGSNQNERLHGQGVIPSKRVTLPTEVLKPPVNRPCYCQHFGIRCINLVIRNLDCP